MTAGGSERGPASIAAAIGVAALVAVLCVALLTSDKVSGAATGLAGGSPGTGLSGTAPSGGGANVGGASSSGSSAAGVSLAQLEANFPLPPGATPDTKHPPINTGTEKVYEVRLGVAATKTFYDSRLPTLAVQWQPLTTTDAGTGAITGWHGGMDLANPKEVGPYLSIDENFFGDMPGFTRIDVDWAV